MPAPRPPQPQPVFPTETPDEYEEIDLIGPLFGLSSSSLRELMEYKRRITLLEQRGG